MIKLFNIPNYLIDTSAYDNLLHGKVVREFEETFADYVGAKYAVSFNSATSAIFLLFNHLKSHTVKIPSIIPPVVPNALVNAGCKVEFKDSVKWVGGQYILHLHTTVKIIDSAQHCSKDCFREYDDDDIMIFSFYPTKPVGSSDGGMVVSNNPDIIDYMRKISTNGMTSEVNNWERVQEYIGHKMYMSSIQAEIALKNLKKLDEKLEKIALVRDRYNDVFDLNNESDHLYRINVRRRDVFMKKAKEAGIQCGIHYTAQHRNPLFGKWDDKDFPKSSLQGDTTVSIPFHENLSEADVTKVIEFVKSNL